MEHTEVPAVKAVMGNEGLSEGLDYRGEKVFSDARKVPGTDWYIITELDQKELYAGFRKQFIWFFSALVLIIVSLVSIVSWLYNRRQSENLKELLEKRTQLFQALEEHGATLYSIGDGVITTDRDGNVKNLNPVAEALTGWTESEARGRPVEEVFNIINEDTRERVESLVQKVLREGQVVGLANHTLLISRNGHETPISDSGSPIKDKNGNLLGVIMVFNDQTKERLHRKLIEIRLRSFEFSIHHSLSEVITHSLDLVGQLLKSPFGCAHLVIPDGNSLWMQAWSSQAMREFCIDQNHRLDVDLTGNGIWADAFLQKKPVIQNDIHSIPHSNGWPVGPAEIKRELVVPVIRDDKVVALVGIANKPEDYNEKDVEIISFMADVSYEIAVQKMRETRLKESEERFVHLFERAPLGYQSLDENGIIIEINQAWCETLGYSKEEVVGKWLGDFMVQNEGDDFSETFLKSNQGGKIHSEVLMLHKNGSKRLIAFEGKIGNRDDGSVEKIHFILRDITESRLLEEKLIENERQLSSIVSNLPGFVYRCKNDDNWTMLYLSGRFKEITGFEPEDFINNRKYAFKNLIKEEYIEKLRYIEGEISDKNSFFSHEYEIFTSTGKLKWVFERGVGVYNKAGELMFLEGYIEDITERKISEIQLRESEEKFRHMFHGHAAIQLIIDPGTDRIVDANEAAASFYGWSVGELMGMKMSSITIVTNENAQYIPKVIKENDSSRLEIQQRKANGEIADIEIYISKLIVGGKTYLYAILHDITEKKIAERALMDSEEKNRLIMDHSMDAILLTKPDGSILSANRAACKLLGMTEDEICKAGRAGLIDPEDPRVLKILLQRDLSGFAAGEMSFIRKDGTRLTAEMSSVLFKNSKGETFSSMIVRDITERKKWERDLLIAKEKAELSDRLKSSFLANMSHEIRTPMNGILGFIDVLNSEELDEKSRHEYMEVVNLSGQRLLDTINDIVEISKIEAGEQEVRYSVVNIQEMIQYHFNFFRLQAKQKGIELFSTLPALSPTMLVESDKFKLGSILTNLIKNAIKFTAEGTIEIGHYVENDSLVFYVKDTGCGIPADKFDAVFERFVQADMSMSRPYEGSGLGLTIAKAYVNLLKGKIWLESEVGKGSTFYFSIPYIPYTEIEKKAGVQIDLPTAYPGENTLLIAEDDDISYRYLEVIMQQKNVTLIRVNNGIDAIRVFKENPRIAAILMDIKMPEMDGIEATKEIRKFNKNVPIIAQTAYAFSGDEEKALQAGCNDYIAKPVNSANLFSVLNRYLIH